MYLYICIQRERDEGKGEREMSERDVGYIGPDCPNKHNP